MESSIVNLAVVDAVRLSGIDFGKQKTIDTCAIGPVKIVLKIKLFTWGIKQTLKNNPNYGQKYSFLIGKIKGDLCLFHLLDQKYFDRGQIF